MEKATNKDAFKKYREREAAETTGTRSGRKYKEKNDATISGRNTAEICAMGRKGRRNITILATEPERWCQ